MSWPSYDEFWVPYKKGKGNNALARVVNGNRVVVPFDSWATEDSLFDGFIVFCAKAGEGELRLHEILQETLDTPVGVGTIPPDK